jgi:hypothetical protein
VNPIKKKLLLYLGRWGNPWNVPLASTLAWLSESRGYLFDTYYDSYHQGGHFPGGDSRALDIGRLSGGTVSGERHFQELYFLLLHFNVTVISFGRTMFRPCLKNLNIPVLDFPGRIADFYKNIFRLCDTPLSPSVVMIGSHFDPSLSGVESYFYPEVFYRRAVGVTDGISEQDLADLGGGRTIFCIGVDDAVCSRLAKNGYAIEVVDRVATNDDYASVTARLARRWENQAKGWILGDPMLVAHWIPMACEENRLSVYAVPQGKIIADLGGLISSKSKVVYGRQSSDRDFFDISRLNQCFQVIDPGRPAFPSVRHADYGWPADESEDGWFEPEVSDDDLRRFAAEGRVLVSLMFWSGMIREVANFHNLTDLFALTRLKCGLVLTAQSFEYMSHSPLELLLVPVEDGGVYPLVEPVLGSAGIGVAIESLLSEERLAENLKEGLARILQKVKKESRLPRGWWATMDADLKKPGFWKKPKPLRTLRYPPYFQARFHKKGVEGGGPEWTSEGAAHVRPSGRFLEKMKRGFKRAHLEKVFVPFRPYEFYRPGPVKDGVIKAAKSAGLSYMFSKAGFGPPPVLLYIDEDFIVLNSTAGQWDGWTPFETINHVSDLKTSERILLGRKRPGWLVSTIDSCLWTFSGEFWKRGGALYDIAAFCAQGGSSGRLINVKPHTIARYARIMAQLHGGGIKRPVPGKMNV